MHRQQGARVPGRLLPATCGSRPGSRARARPRRVPRRRGSANDRRRPRGAAVEGACRAARRRAARRGSAARVRRVDAGEAPGGRVVGRVVRQPQLGAVPAPVRARRLGQRRLGRRRRAVRRRPPSPASRELAESARVSVALASLGPTVSWPGDVPATSTLSASSFDRTLDWWWRRTSFSDITAGTYEPHVASEPEEPVVEDEATPLAPPAPSDGHDALREVPSLLAEMPVGVEIGTLVHRVFESVDFASTDLAAELSTAIAAAQARRRVELGDTDAVVAGLRAAIETPLGSLAGGIALRDVTRRDRLDELDFELPLVGGDDPSGPASPSPRSRASCTAHGRPLAATRERLLDPRLARASAAISPAASTSCCESTASASRSSTTRPTGSRHPAKT